MGVGVGVGVTVGVGSPGGTRVAVGVGVGVAIPSGHGVGVLPMTRIYHRLSCPASSSVMLIFLPVTPACTREAFSVTLPVSLIPDGALFTQSSS